MESFQIYVEPIAEAQSRLEALLHEYQANDRMAPITVVVPTTYAGLFLRRDVGRQGLANVRFIVMPRLSELLGAPTLAARGLRPLTKVIESAAVRSVAMGSEEPFKRFRHHPSFHSGLRSTFSDLRHAQTDTLKDIERRGGTQGEIIRLYRGFRDFTKAYYDREALSIAAADALTSGRSAALRDLGPIVVYLAHDLTPGERRVVEALASSWTCSIIFGATDDKEADTDMRGMVAKLKGTLDEPRESTPPIPGESKLFIASDGVEEIRWITRSIAADAHDGVPFHRMAVLYWQRDPYASLISEQLGMAGVPITGPAPGTLASTAAGRTVRGLADLAGGELSRDAVMQWLTGSPLKSTTKDFRPSQWDIISRSAGVVAGVDQWHDRLERYATRLERSAQDQSEEISDAKADRIMQAAREARALRDYVLELNGALTPPENGKGWSDFGTWMRGLIDRYLDDYALSDDEQSNLDTFLSGLREIEALEDLNDRATFDEFRTALDELLNTPASRQVRFGEGVFVGPVGASIGLRFDEVYLVGMVEGLVPSRVGDDPLLPDHERTQTELPLRRNAATRQRYEYLAAISAGKSHVLTFARGDNIVQKAQHPSRWFLEEASRLSRSQVFATTLASLTDKPWLEVIASQEDGLGSVGSTQPADVHDYDLHRLWRWRHSGQPIVKHHLPASENVLTRAWDMERARDGRALTIWDGDLSLVSQTSSRIALTEHSAFSPTSLEAWATCPYRYFLSNVLGVAALEQPEEVATITPLERGSLVHSILERFVREVQEQKVVPKHDQPWEEGHSRLLIALADREFQDAENRGVTGKSLLWELVKAEIRSDLHAFLEEDFRIRREYGVSPHSVELAFGNPRHGRKGSQSVPAVVWSGADSAGLSFRGIVDRVDVAADNERALVIDYKTGSSGPFARLDEDSVDRGKRLQLPIYGLMARQLLGEDIEVRVAYWFVSTRGGFRMRPSVPMLLDGVLEPFRRAVGTITHGIGNGFFPANPGGTESTPLENCRYCDFDRLCLTKRAAYWGRKHNDPRLADYVSMASGSAAEESE